MVIGVTGASSFPVMTGGLGALLILRISIQPQATIVLPSEKFLFSRYYSLGMHRAHETTTSDSNSPVRTIRLTRRFLTFATHRVVGLLHVCEAKNSTRSPFHDERHLL